MVCRPGQSESGADDTVVAAVIDSRVVFTQNIYKSVKYFHEFGFYQY